MLLMWNESMDQYFSHAWITCLDESILFCSNNYTCPWFMFVSWKPCPFGNKYHSICLRLLGVLFGIYSVEGKEWPKDLGKPVYFDNGGATFGFI